jgi:transposase
VSAKLRYDAVMKRHELSDPQWERLAPLLPPQRPARGRPNQDHRRILNGIHWRLKTGAPWRDIPERYGPWQTLYSRYRRWQQAGVWDRILAILQAEADARGALDWEVHVIDGSVVRAHQHAAGAKRGTRRPKRSATVGAGSAPSCTSAPSVAASR